MNLKESLVERIMLIAPEGTCQRSVLERHLVESLNGILIGFERDLTAAETDAALAQQAETAAARAILEMNRREADEPRRAQAEARDRVTFTDAARTLRFGQTEGNFQLLKSILGENFSVYSIQQLIAGQPTMLSAPTSEELAQWQQELIAARNEFLKNADGSTLRSEARKEAEANYLAQQQEQVAREDQARAQRDAGRYPPLPEFWRGSKLNAAAIKAMTRETLTTLIKMYGSHQVTEALRTRP